ncbi:SMYD5-like protein [Mya arenaria]|uniref:SMYD5-like protein n=1 Tax=Mya arenaria TaxID=6604 RepID=A0ABY7EUV1_MYAAR|nr:SMYD5-like protein [Mya arenaria]
MPEILEEDKRIVALSALLEEDRSSGNLIERAQLFLNKELWRPALEDAKAALVLDTTSVPAYIVAGKAALKLKRFEESYNYYKEGLELDSKNKTIIEDFKVLQNEIVTDYDERAQHIPEKKYKAVELCSQDVYPGDDELFKLETDILLKKYKIDVNDVIKPTDVTISRRKEAASFGVMAYNAQKDKRLEEALQCCHVALGKDPTNYRLLHMRATVFEDLDETAHALRNLFMIPKPFRFIEAWKLGGKLLNKLDLPVLAEFWLRKATAMVPEANRHTDLDSATLFQQVRVKRIYGPLTKECPVKVAFTDYGRALLSCIHLPACANCGASLITAKDFFGAKYNTLPPELRAFADEHWPNVKGFPCRKCDKEIYCTVSCREEAWSRYHQIVCPSVNPAGNDLYDLIKNKGQGQSEKGKWQDLWVGQYSPIVLVKIWAMIVAEAKRLIKERGIHLVWNDICHPEDAGKCGEVSYPISEAEFEARYYQATCNLQAFSASKSPGTDFIENISETEDIRTLAMLKFLEENSKNATVSFAGMFPLHACLNHACNNNVEVTDGFAQGRPAVHVHVRQPIKPGEELFTTYIDTAMPRKLRRAWLYKSFSFWCICKRCQFEGDDNSTCTECKAPAADGKKLPGCSRCKRAWYCSGTCQKKAWMRGHKDICSLDHTSVHKRITEN